MTKNNNSESCYYFARGPRKRRSFSAYPVWHDQ